MKKFIKTESDLFYSALTREPGSGRTQFLDAVCNGDVDKRRRLDALLSAHEQSGDLLDTVDVSPQRTVDPVHDLTGSTIGTYKLLQLIGEGGMGVVYLAEQQHPVRRRVALKIIKPGMDTREVIARFEAERQALALMDHAHVARVLDAGSTNTGRPFFAMELVQGVRINTFVVTENLTVAERLKLFVAVCRAIQHAHLKGIIHRDIKPSNVLVTQQHGESMPKVIDFGIAKAINQSLTEKTLHTAHGQLVGTPSYMSPEQAERDGHDVDTRTDVYSLGVLLYELLTGMTPFDVTALKAAGPEGVRQIIRDSQPLRPSIRVGTSPAGKAAVSADSAAGDVRRQQHYLKGDLDWIVMKAIEKDRDRRYDSAAAFADDILRFLDGEAVLARPPSALYRLQKVSTRYRGVIVATLLILVALSVGLAVAVVQRNKAVASQQLAEERLRDMHSAQLQTETLLYAADVRLAARAIDDGDVAQATELLERSRPRQEQHTDLRGLEWHYLYHKAAGAAASYPVTETALYTVKLCPDHNRLVAAGADGMLYVLSPNTLTIDRAVNSEQVQVNGVSFSADGRVLCSAGDNGTVRLWSYPELAPLKTIPFADDVETYSAILSRDEQSVIVCGQLPEVRIYSRVTGAQTGRLAGHDRPVEAIALSPDGQTLACVSSDRRLSVWDWRNEQQLYLSPCREKRLSSVAFLANGCLIADGAISGEVHVTSVGDWQETASLQLTDGIQALVMSPFRETLCVATRAGDIISYAVGSTQSQALLESDQLDPASDGTHAHDGRIYDLEYMGDGIVISVGQDGRVCRTRVADAASDSDTRVISEIRSRTVTVSPDGHHIIGCRDRTLYAYDVAECELRKLNQFPNDVDWSAVAITPDGSLLAAADAHGQLAIAAVESDTAAEIHQLPGDLDVARLRYSRHGNRLTIVSRSHDQIVVAEFPSLQEVCRRTVVNNDNAVLSADGGLLAYNDAHDLLVVDVATGSTLVRSKNHHSETIVDLAFSANGRSIVSISNDRSIHVWNWADRSSPELLGVHSGGRPATFAISNDEQTLLTCSRAGDVVVWSIPARQELFTLTHTESDYYSMFLSDNDRTLITVDAEGQVAWLDLAPQVSQAEIRP